MKKLVNVWKTKYQFRKNKRNVNEVAYNEINLNEYILLDVRSFREFKEKHIEGAINIPLTDLKKKIEYNIKDKSKKILVYCEYGGRSAKGVKILQQLGYNNVFNLKGGLEKI